ncbi:oxidoreductase [Ilyomonas limi]|uniref:Oxidoreductase n=1 Tax=Ilyomonas limi TaxID=2575867 RepID=A0A4U3L190_9BACT|nr:YCF48-related protein [Ilyomonas limi]TKK67246.1 oxidoreductase [Ilyomonas limi]
MDKQNLLIRAIRVIRAFEIHVLLVFLFLFIAFYSRAQTIQVLTSGANTSLRGLSVVNNSVLWASGSNGTVARSTDGGKTFNWITVKGYEQRDFRDVEAFDSNTAIIMAIAEPAIILKTLDGGKTWKKVFEDSTKGMFLDAMDFAGDYGVVVGDPIDKKAFIAVTEDSGNHWHSSSLPYALDSNEAFFASSGTNVKLNFDSFERIYNHVAVSGGSQSNLLIDKKYKLPLLQGKETQGANSVTINPKNKRIVVVGGDFKNDKESAGNCVLVSLNKKIKIEVPQTPPHGYRSCVEFINDKQLITCGTSGVDISNDGGMNWTLISPESFHVCQKAKEGNAVFLAGKNGRIAKLYF